MPISTIWRQLENNTAIRGVSPERPAFDHIERISPEPYSPIHESSYHSQPHTPPVNPLQGLGLSSAGLLEENHTYEQPDHIYLDQNGSACVATRHSDIHPVPSLHTSPTARERLSKQSKQYREARRSRARVHTRSGSTIDDLASAAIATSPSFGPMSPDRFANGPTSAAYSPSRPSTSYISRPSYDDETAFAPPPKRVKSERLHSTEWSPNGERFRSSYERVEINQEDAELLLFLKQHDVNFKTQSSPPAPPSAALAYPYTEHYAAKPDPAPIETRGEKIHINGESLQEITPPSDFESMVDQLAEQNTYTHHVEQLNAEPLSTTNGNNTVPDIVHQDQMEGDTVQTREGPGVEQITMQKRKPKRIKPEVQAEVCASCHRLQRDINDENLTMWISCNACSRWFHSACAGFKSKADARSVDKFVCKQCEPEHGRTTFVRKSSRARTAIDYAGLNQGVVKSSVDTSLHHYIQPIKDGRIQFLPDDFARVRPEVLTMEFLQSYDGMKRPFVVPACWNPRFGVRRRPQKAESFIPASDFGEECFTNEGEPVDSPPELPAEKWEEAIDCDQDFLGMVMPRDLTVRKVADLYGPEEPVPVIDVKTQETKGTYTLGQWADYYEEPGEKPIRNVISLEVSESRLGRLIKRPQVVCDLDLEDQVWDQESRTASKKRPVQFYCLMSVGDSYTDFHIDFGGSSVYYHILKGQKTFFFIPPEDKYLKKYEDWCNSDSQNDTFLGNLCGGNCTRVDLFPGDTAFIPAGWIHAVWTPSDSLVVGGNFLTRLDYELQLKVVNVEKMTKVSPKFRYPFFQKVMWYTLIRYLEDDPVSEEVVRDFMADPEYIFLRANPVWHEIGDFANTEEPGNPYYNARYYAKSEIHGLPPLREYLYRTARIYADLPVNDINKKGIEAVKASIPKGFGDPMQLIKMFAIWCAWKTGLQTVPEWVHSDEGATLEDIKREKIRKIDAIKVASERVSTRRSSQMQMRNTPETTNIPAKATIVTPIKVAAPPTEVESDSGKKSRGTARGSGLRVACESCRKRRIKCRHKPGEASSPDDSGAVPASTTRARSQSEISIDLNQSAVSPTAADAIIATTTYSDLQNDSYLAQDVSASSEAGEQNGAMVNGYLGGNKKSRSKACEECRKSKRRCVHDELGRVDPAKAAEPAKPRGTLTGKRPARMSDEYLQFKRPKTEADVDDGLADITTHNDADVPIDPALLNLDMETESMDMNNDAAILTTDPGVRNDITTVSVSRQDPMDQIADVEVDEVADADESLSSVDPALFDTDMVTIESEIQTKDNVSPSTDSPLTDDSPAVQLHQEAEAGAMPLGILVDGVENDTVSALAPRQSSRFVKQVERYGPGKERSPSKSQTRQSRSERRTSSDASAQTAILSTKSRRSSSNTSGTTHRMTAVSTSKRKVSNEESIRPVSRGSTGGESEMDADERFARELQASENGLRRRPSVRV